MVLKEVIIIKNSKVMGENFYHISYEKVEEAVVKIENYFISYEGEANYIMSTVKEIRVGKKVRINPYEFLDVLGSEFEYRGTTESLNFHVEEGLTTIKLYYGVKEVEEINKKKDYFKKLLQLDKLKYWFSYTIKDILK